MSFFWKCHECDEVNDYSKTKVCETCGTDISALEERRIQEKIKLEKEREKAEKQRKFEEQLRKANEKKERELLKDRKKICDIIIQSCKIPSIVMRALIGAATIAAIIICVMNFSHLNFANIFENPGQNISAEFNAHVDITQVEKTVTDVSKNDTKQGFEETDSSKENKSEMTEQKTFHLVNNIRSEFLYLSQNFHPVDNFLEFIGAAPKITKESN